MKATKRWLQDFYFTSKSKGVLLTDPQYSQVLDVSDRHFFITNGYLRSFSSKEELVEFGYISLPSSKTR